MTPTGQTRLLLSGIELLVGNRFDELELLNADSSVTMLSLFGQALKPNVMTGLLKQLKQQHIHSVSWKYMPVLLQALDKFKLDDVDELYQACIDNIVSSHERYTLEDLTDTLEIMVRQRIYCPELVTCIADRAVHGEDVGVHERITVARLFHKQEYGHLELLCKLSNELAGDEARELVGMGEIEIGDLRDVLHCWADAHYMLGKDTVEDAVKSVMQLLAENLTVFMPGQLLHTFVFQKM